MRDTGYARDTGYMHYSNKLPQTPAPAKAPKKDMSPVQKAAQDDDEEAPICFVKAYARKPMGVPTEKGQQPNSMSNDSNYYYDDDYEFDNQYEDNYYSDSEENYYDDEDENEYSSEEDDDGIETSEEESAEETSSEDNDSDQNELDRYNIGENWDP